MSAEPSDVSNGSSLITESTPTIIKLPSTAASSRPTTHVIAMTPRTDGTTYSEDGSLAKFLKAYQGRNPNMTTLTLDDVEAALSQMGLSEGKPVVLRDKSAWQGLLLAAQAQQRQRLSESRTG